MTTINVKERELTQDFRDKYVIDLKGKDFVSFDGLLLLGISEGVTSIKTEIYQTPNNGNHDTAVIHAIVFDKDGKEWHGTGDASPTSVGKQLVNATIRMAETRAIGRALRMMLGVGTMLEEMYDPYEVRIVTTNQIGTIRHIMKERYITKETAAQLAFDAFGKTNAMTLSEVEAEAFIVLLRQVNIDNVDEVDEVEEE